MFVGRMTRARFRPASSIPWEMIVVSGGFVPDAVKARGPDHGAELGRERDQAQPVGVKPAVPVVSVSEPCGSAVKSVVPGPHEVGLRMNGSSHPGDFRTESHSSS